MDILHSAAVKAIGDYTLSGRAVVFGGKDLVGDTFTKQTDLGDTRPFEGLPVYWNHATGTLKSQIGVVKSWVPTDEGIDVEIELDQSHRYIKEVIKLVRTGRVGLSSGAVSHLVERIGGELKRWPIGELSLTMTPAEPRTLPGVKTLGEQSPDVDNAGGNIADTSAQSESTIKNSKETTMTAIDKDALKQALLDLNGEPVQGGGAYMGGEAPKAKKNTSLGFSNERNEAWAHYIKTGDKVAMKATVVEGTDANGGYNVPDELQSIIETKRDEESILGALPIKRVRTSRDYYDVVVGNDDSDFAFTAEAGAANEDGPTFGQSSIRVYKATLLIKVSEEVMNDAATNLQQYLTDEIGYALARHVNQYILTGSGSSQPYGIAGRAGISETLASATGVDAADINNIFYKLPAAYHGRNTGWAMRMATLGGIRSLQGNPFLFQNTPAGVNGQPGEFLHNRPVFASDKVAAPTTGNTSILFGDWSKYYFVENGGLTIKRNEYSYMENGLIGIFATVRWGGDLVIPNAFVKGVQA